MTGNDRRSITELRRMDEQEARQSLTVAEYERWESINQLHDEAEETREQWEEEEQEVSDLVVRADPEQLGTEVDLFGNDVLVRVDSEDRRFREAAESLSDEIDEGDTPEDVPDLDDETRERVGELLETMLDRVLVRWDGHDWQGLGDGQRAAVLAECREKWGVDGLMLAFVDIVAAVNEDREEKVSIIESFRQSERAGRN